MRAWTLTDVKPRLFLCPLPKGYWWEVRLLQWLNSVHMELRKKRALSSGEAVVVLNFLDKSTDEVMAELIEGSYVVWQKFFRVSYQKDDRWQQSADELRERLVRGPAKVRVKLEKLK